MEVYRDSSFTLNELVRPTRGRIYMRAIITLLKNIRRELSHA